MSLANHALAEASVAQAAVSGTLKKAPPKRTARALADRKLAPEPR